MSTSRRYVSRPSLVAALLAMALPLSQAKAQTADELTGQVFTTREGAMEGVVVSARRVGSTITVSVVSNAQGQYRFPAGRLQAGRQELAVRASGYALTHNVDVDVAPSAASTADIELQPTPVTASDLTNAEWMASAPGSDDIKRQLLNCTDCHSLQRVFESKHTKQEFLDVFERMAGYYPGASDMQPQRLVGSDRRPPLPSGMEDAVAGYLASVNRSTQSESPFPYRTLPRATGPSTHVIVTEYALPRPEIQPHDVIVDRDGAAWFGHFGENILSRLDAATGQVTDFAIPPQRPGWPMGTLDVEFDRSGNIWIGLMYQTGLGRFDPTTKSFRIFPLPKEWLTNATQQSHFSVAGLEADGAAWVKNSDRSQIMRLDTTSGHYSNLGTQLNPATHSPIGVYGVYADQQNVAYILDFGAGGIGRITAGGSFRFYPTPTANARARRGRVDSTGRLWFAEYGGDAIAMLDPKADTIAEWRMPWPWEAPYDVVADRFGAVWEVNEASDRVGRLDPASGQIIEYLLPHPANIRRVFVDDCTAPGVIWFGSNHGAAVVKVEPLD